MMKQESYVLDRLKEIFPNCQAKTLYEAAKNCTENHLSFLLCMNLGQRDRITRLEKEANDLRDRIIDLQEHIEQ